jgi:hypothetical protein
LTFPVILLPTFSTLATAAETLNPELAPAMFHQLPKVSLTCKDAEKEKS